jgi:hypothetical protein
MSARLVENVCCGSWRRSCLGFDDLVEYETRLNYIWPLYRDAVICVYDLGKFGGHIVIDVLRTHPMVLIGGIIQENPFFQPPDEFLQELRERRATRSAALRDVLFTLQWAKDHEGSERRGGLHQIPRCMPTKAAAKSR